MSVASTHRPNHSCERTPIKPVVRGPEPLRRRSIHRSAGIAGVGVERAVCEVRGAHRAQTIVAVWRDSAGTDCTDHPMIPPRSRGVVLGQAGDVAVEVSGSAVFEDLPNHALERTAIKPLVGDSEPFRRRSACRSAGIAGFGFARAVREVREARAPQTTVAVRLNPKGTDCTDHPMILPQSRGLVLGQAGEAAVDVSGSVAFDDLPNHALERTAIKRPGAIPEPLRRRSACRSTESVSDRNIR